MFQKLHLYVFLLLLVSFSVCAQENFIAKNTKQQNSNSSLYRDDVYESSRTKNFKYAFGLKYGKNVPGDSTHYGYFSVASFRLFFNDKVAWEANVVLDPEQWEFNSYYQKHYPLSKKTYKSFNAYWGAGFHYGKNYYFKRRTTGFSSVVGLDYTFQTRGFPYALSIEVGPYSPNIFAKNRYFELRPSLGFRYCFDY